MDAIRQETTIQDLLKEERQAKKLLEQQTEALLFAEVDTVYPLSKIKEADAHSARGKRSGKNG